MSKKTHWILWLTVLGLSLAAVMLVFRYVQTSSPWSTGENPAVLTGDPGEVPAGPARERGQSAESEKTVSLTTSDASPRSNAIAAKESGAFVSTEPATPPPNVAAIPSEPLYTPPASVEAMYEEQAAVAACLLEDLPDAANSFALMGQVCNNQGNMEEAEIWLGRCLELNPNRADVYSALGEIALLKGAYEKAAAFFDRALGVSPTLGGGYNNLARALMGHGKIDEAIPALEKGIEVSPRNSQGYVLLGQAYLQLKEYPEAKKNYQAAIAIQPKSREAHYGLAMACARLGQKDQSGQSMETFKSLKAGHRKARAAWIVRSYDDLDMATQSTVWTFVEAGRIYDRHQNPQKAEQLWRKAAILDPRNKECRMHLALRRLASNRQQEALELCKQIEDIDPDKADTYLMTGTIYLRLERFTDAEQAFAKAIERAPRHPEGYCRLASLYLGAKPNLPRARALAEAAVQLQPIARNYLMLCQARDRTGDLAGALSAIERAMDLDPNTAKYRQIREWLEKRE